MEQALNAFSALSIEREKKTVSSKPDLELIIAEQYAQMRSSLLSYIYHLVGSFRDAEDIQFSQQSEADFLQVIH